ncbi:MAG: hypothetical protein JOZ36_06020 [Acidobacteria bacterium]|nr:hypothetical protein [Acidobacteriota bacterium]
MKLYGLSLLIVSCVSSALASVTVSAPGNNSKVAQSVQYVAHASTSCRRGIAAMGIYTAPYVLAYRVSGARLNTILNLNPNTTYYTMVQEWDNCGGASKVPITIHVGGGSAKGKTFYNLHQQGGWNGFGMLPPAYNICGNCSPSVTWSRWTGVKSPSLSGSSTQHNLGGTSSPGYKDAFWNNHLIGDFSTQGLPDNSKTLVPSLHNFVYDVYFYGNNIGASQALEFDINQFFGGKSFIWGHECRIAGGNEWDVWDNGAHHWHATGIPCYPNNNAWNHLTIQVQRSSSDQVVFQSITLNGVQRNVNYVSYPTGTSWYGLTINYQQDGNYKQSGYSIWLDKLNFSYW